MGIGGEAFDLAFVFEGADGDGRLCEIFFRPSAVAAFDAARQRLLIRQGEMPRGFIREETGRSTRRREKFRFPDRGFSAGNDRALAGEREKQGQARQRAHARRAER